MSCYAVAVGLLLAGGITFTSGWAANFCPKLDEGDLWVRTFAAAIHFPVGSGQDNPECPQAIWLLFPKSGMWSARKVVPTTERMSTVGMSPNTAWV